MGFNSGFKGLNTFFTFQISFFSVTSVQANNLFLMFLSVDRLKTLTTDYLCLQSYKQDFTGSANRDKEVE